MFHLPSTKSTTIHLDGFDRPLIEPADLPEDAVLVRRATARDAAHLRTLALLDDRRLPEGPFIVAELAGEVVAAMSLSCGTIVADPFRRTRDAEALLRVRSGQIAQHELIVASARQHHALKPAPAA
jgi:hypothetical protein